jgi:hypothetical protein
VEQFRKEFNNLVGKHPIFAALVLGIFSGLVAFRAPRLLMLFWIPAFLAYVRIGELAHSRELHERDALVAAIRAERKPTELEEEHARNVASR